MPTYDYLCEDEPCNHTFEHYQSMFSDVLTICPRCKKSSLKRLIGKGSAIIFKGSGFYQTDYKSVKEDGRKSAKADGENVPKD